MEDIKSLMLLNQGYQCMNDASWNATAELLEKAHQDAKILDIEIAFLNNRLKELSQSKNSFGTTYRYFFITRKGTVKYADIPELKDVDLELYRSDSTTYWKIDRI